jgi:hypothetical protein
VFLACYFLQVKQLGAELLARKSVEAARVPSSSPEVMALRKKKLEELAAELAGAETEAAEGEAEVCMPHVPHSTPFCTFPLGVLFARCGMVISLA